MYTGFGQIQKMITNEYAEEGCFGRLQFSKRIEPREWNNLCKLHLE